MCVCQQSIFVISKIAKRNGLRPERVCEIDRRVRNFIYAPTIIFGPFCIVKNHRPLLFHKNLFYAYVNITMNNYFRFLGEI